MSRPKTSLLNMTWTEMFDKTATAYLTTVIILSYTNKCSITHKNVSIPLSCDKYMDEDN